MNSVSLRAGEVRVIGAIRVNALSRAKALASLADALVGKRSVKLAFCNANLVNLAANNAELQEVLLDFLILPDGIGVDIASRLLYGSPFPANLNGTDFLVTLLCQVKSPLKVMLLGARPGVAERAASALKQIAPAHEFDVLRHGYFNAEELTDLLQRLRDRRPDLLLVALGSPDQELWIARHIDDRACTVAAGVGAFLDLLAGEPPRAPAWLRAARVEWVYRLYQEPARLWRRYLIGNIAFLARVASAFISQQRDRLTSRKDAN